MDEAQAKTELLRHAGLVDSYYADGFLGCLRPYSGIRDENFHAVVESMVTVGHSIATDERIDRELMQAIHCILTFGRLYALDEDGMLVRNRLISPSDRSRFKRQLRVIEQQTSDLLAGRPPFQILHGYCEYLAEFGWGSRFTFLLPLLSQAILAEEFGDRIEGYCAAIAKLGPPARVLKDSLELARARHWEWFEPTDRCDAETKGHIDAALAALASIDS